MSVTYVNVQNVPSVNALDTWRKINGELTILTCFDRSRVPRRRQLPDALRVSHRSNLLRETGGFYPRFYQI